MALAILGMVELVVRATVLVVLALSVLGWFVLSGMEASQFEPTSRPSASTSSKGGGGSSFGMGWSA